MFAILLFWPAEERVQRWKGDIETISRRLTNVSLLCENFSLHAHTRKIISPWSEKQMLVMFTITMCVRSCAV